MILYQVVKWLEERMRLVRSIKEARGDVSSLINRKETIDRYIDVQTQIWTEKNDQQIVPALPPAPTLQSEYSLLNAGGVDSIGVDDSKQYRLEICEKQ